MVVMWRKSLQLGIIRLYSQYEYTAIEVLEAFNKSNDEQLLGSLLNVEVGCDFRAGLFLGI